MSVTTGERVAISGANGSGKSTLIRALLEDTALVKTGSWHLLKREAIGYLDQHYSKLDMKKTVFDIIQDQYQVGLTLRLESIGMIFYFVKTKKSMHLFQVFLAARKHDCAAITPTLLILDEITNMALLTK